MDDNVGCLQLLLAIVEVLLLALVATFGALDLSAIQDLLDLLDESNCFPVKGPLCNIEEELTTWF